MKTKEEGIADYDYKHDILFFKTKKRTYKKSIELDNIVLDVDEGGFITGIQIFEVSKFLNLSKEALLKWQKCDTFLSMIKNRLILFLHKYIPLVRDWRFLTIPKWEF